MLIRPVRLMGRKAAGRAPAWRAQSLAYFAAITVQPDNDRMALIDTFIGALIEKGIWSKLDYLCIRAAHDSQAARVNAVSPGTYDSTAVNAPTFTTDRGYQGNGSTSYLDTNFVPSTAGKMTQNDASMGCWSLNDVTGFRRIMGAIDNVAGTDRYALMTGLDTDLLALGLNSPFPDQPQGTGSATKGFYVGTRTASDLSKVYKNGISTASSAFASGSPPTIPVFVLADNEFGAASGHSTHQTALDFAGAGLSDQNVSDFYDAALAYLQAVGAA